MITVATYRNLIEADMGRSRLNAEGIETFIPDQATTTAGYGPVTGWIRLQVRESDAVRATAILSEAEPAGLPDDFDPGTGPDNGAAESGKRLASDGSLPEELRRLSRTVQNCSIAVVVALLLTCIYISFKFRGAYRVYEENNKPSLRDVPPKGVLRAR